MAFTTKCGKYLDTVLLDGSNLRDELEGVDIHIQVGKPGDIKAIFPHDASWIRGHKKLLSEAVESVKSDVIGKGWWSCIQGLDGEEIIGFL